MISRFGRTRTAIAASFLAAIGASEVGNGLGWAGNLLETWGDMIFIYMGMGQYL